MKLPCVTVYQTPEGKPYTVEEGGITFDGRRRLNCPQSVFDFISDTHLPFRAGEAVIAIFCDSRLRPVSFTEISRGTVKTSLIPIREIIQCALLSHAAVNNVILVHNHPSGDTNPSQDDLNVTLKLKNALNLVEMYLQDHMVVSPSGYTSIREFSTASV